MIITTDIKMHYVVPETQDFFYTIDYSNTDIDNDPSYRKQLVSNINEFTFPQDHYPFRVEDIFVESLATKFVLSNRPEFINGEETKKLFNYNKVTRTITFNRTLKGTHIIHWLDFSKSNPYQGYWRKLPIAKNSRYVNKLLYQGFAKTSDSSDEILDITDQDGKFQGAFRCYLEINTLPYYGMVCYSDDMKSFLYRGTSTSSNIADTFQYKLYNVLGQESDPKCYRILFER